MTDIRVKDIATATTTDSTDYLLMDSATNGTQKISPSDLPINDSTQSALDLKANDSAVVHKTTGETITGQKVFNNASNTFYGIGTNLTALDATNITSGTLNAARLPASGVSAATYKNMTATVDIYGRITSVSNGIDYEAITTKTGNYTLQQSDNGSTILVNVSSGATITIPDSLSAGFSCLIVQVGTAQVTFAGSGSMTLRNRSSYTKTAGQYAVAGLTVYLTNNVLLSGDCT